MDLYARLSETDLLRRAWHLARRDSRSDFTVDPYRHSDYGLTLEENLKYLSHRLESGQYQAKPLGLIDVPKSTLSVRPGTTLDIEDKIVLLAIAILLAPKMDKQLPPNVYSWRVREEAGRDDLFEDHELLRFPFLKASTITKRLDLVEPWYAAWPEFHSDLRYAYEKEGYTHLVVSDIAAYFENIDHSTLRDTILRYWPQQQRLINFLFRLLSSWTWPGAYGSEVNRGIPQGNSVSSFLGNVYLLPLDKALVRASRILDLKYLRYMDDDRVLAKDENAARRALFLLNDKMRELHLNIQGAKTRILVGQDARSVFFNPAMDRVNGIVKEIDGAVRLERAGRQQTEAKLRAELRAIRTRARAIDKDDLRIFLRLMTGYTLIQHSGLVRRVLLELERNPDGRLLTKAVKYLRCMTRNESVIAERVAGVLTSGRPLFDYQTAHFLAILRYCRVPSRVGLRYARRVLRRDDTHWYVRVQAALLLSAEAIPPDELQRLLQVFKSERVPAVKRALMHCLVQFSYAELKEVIRDLLFSDEPGLRRLGRMYFEFLYDREAGRQQVASLFRDWQEVFFADRYSEVEALGKARSRDVRQLLHERLSGAIRQVRRPGLRDRMGRLRDELAATLREQMDLPFDFEGSTK